MGIFIGLHKVELFDKFPIYICVCVCVCVFVAPATHRTSSLRSIKSRQSAWIMVYSVPECSVNSEDRLTSFSSYTQLIVRLRNNVVSTAV